MRILTSNLIMALRLAIKAQKESEQQIRPNYESIFVGGLKDVLAAAERGDTITVSSR